MTPTGDEIERLNLYDVNARLENTFHLLWSDHLLDPLRKNNDSVMSSLPEVGSRWLAASTVLGFAEYRLGRWVTQLSCWWRHGRYKTRMKQANPTFQPSDSIQWRYLKVLFEQALKSGCSGPQMAGQAPASECISAGAQCKSRRSGRRNEGLALPFRSTIGPCTKPFERPEPDVIHSSGCRPAGKYNDTSQSIVEFSKLADEGGRKVIELVAIGALQPVELVHPWAWRFANGDVEDVLRQAFRRYIWTEPYYSSVIRPPPVKSDSWLQAPTASMGGLFKALCFDGLEVVLKLPKNIWTTQFISHKAISFDAWAQQAVHDAVLPSLEGRARETAVVAQCFLSGSDAIHDNELELFCGLPPTDPLFLDSISRSFYASTPSSSTLPKSIAWRNGVLVNSVILDPFTRFSEFYSQSAFQSMK